MLQVLRFFHMHLLLILLNFLFFLFIYDRMVKLNILVGVALLGFFCSQTAPVEASTMTLVEADVSYDVDLALASMDPNSEAALLYKSKRAKAKKEIKRGVKHAVHDIDKGKKSALKHMNREIKSAKKHDQDEKEEYMKMGRGYVKTYMNEAKDYVKSGAKHGIDAVNNYGELENATEPQQAVRFRFLSNLSYHIDGFTPDFVRLFAILYCYCFLFCGFRPKIPFSFRTVNHFYRFFSIHSLLSVFHTR